MKPRFNDYVSSLMKKHKILQSDLVEKIVALSEKGQLGLKTPINHVKLSRRLSSNSFKKEEAEAILTALAYCLEDIDNTSDDEIIMPALKISDLMFRYLNNKGQVEPNQNHQTIDELLDLGRLVPASLSIDELDNMFSNMWDIVASNGYDHVIWFFRHDEDIPFEALNGFGRSRETMIRSIVEGLNVTYISTHAIGATKTFKLRHDIQNQLDLIKQVGEISPGFFSHIFDDRLSNIIHYSSRVSIFLGPDVQPKAALSLPVHDGILIYPLEQKAINELTTLIAEKLDEINENEIEYITAKVKEAPEATAIERFFKDLLRH